MKFLALHRRIIRRLRRWRQRCIAPFVVREFNRIYYDGPNGASLFHTTSWLGVETLKCPLDLWIYQEIIWRTKPELIVEAGVHKGGSALYLASICNLLGRGEVVGCDITLDKVHPKVHAHPRIELIEGSSTDPAIVEKIAEKSRGRRTMVILDSDHTYSHVRNELKMYAPLVTPGCYLICEDTNINGHPVYKDFGPGPYEAVKEFLRSAEGWSVDHNCERLLVSFNPNGYLYREPLPDRQVLTPTAQGTSKTPAHVIRV